MRRSIVVAAVLMTGMLLGALPASAHPTLLVTDPAADTAVADSPPAITLVFNEAITIGPTALTLLDAGNRSLPLGVAHMARGGHLLTAALPITLHPGVYVVRWRVTGSDGDLMEEQFPFGVGATILGLGSGSTPSISWPEAALRWLLFGGIAVSAGSLVGRRFTASARRMKPALVTIRPWVLPGAVVAGLGVAGLAVALILGTGSAPALWQGRAGRLLIVEGLALLVAVTLALIRKPAWTSAPLLIVVAAEGVRSHANVADPGWGAVLTATHLAAAAIWVGTLLYVTRAVFAWRTDGAAVRWVMAGYARLAIWVFAVVITTGTLSALLLVPLSTVFTTSYGRVLLIKLALVVAAAAVAVAARRTLRTEHSQDRIRTRVRAESVALVVVLALSAVLVSTPPAVSALPIPPPAPAGLVVPLGGMAGQIGVGVQASAGQLVIRLSTPNRGDGYGPAPAQSYTLSGQLSAHDFPAGHPVTFRDCGPGCFTAAASWQTGENVLTLHAQTPGWTGGTVGLLVPWPAQPGGHTLAAVTAALRAADRITIYEQVTSDTSQPAPPPYRLDLTGKFFLAQEPYATGVAPIAVRISRPGQPPQLALQFPAASISVLLTLDPSGRISEETLTADTHLIHRHFLYPAH